MNEIALVTEMSILDKLFYGLEMLLFGLGTVFAVLILLWGILILFKFFFHTLPARAEKSEVVAAYREGKEKLYTPAPAPVPAVQAVSSDDEELAAIIAAITAFRKSQNNDRPFRVVSFKKR